MTKATMKATDNIRAINHFNAQTDSVFSTRVDYYVKDSKAEVDAFYDFVANSVARYLATGDVSHVNTCIKGALTNGRYRSCLRIMKSVVAHKFDKAGKKLVGKINKDAKAKLIAIDADTGLEQWELKLKNNVTSETKFAKTKPARAWGEDAAIAQLIKKAQENNVDLSVIGEKVAAAVKAAA